MIPLLVNPFALLALAAVPALMAIYLLRSRFRRQPVSSLLLWQGLSRTAEGGRHVKRLQFPLLMLLELAAIVLLVFAAIDVRWPAGVGARSLVAVLDDSASMLAKGPRGTAREQALRQLKRELARERFKSVRILVAGVRPRFADLPPGRLTGSALESALAREWRCCSPDSDIAGAVTLASDVGGERTVLLVLTDHAPAGKPAESRVRWLAFGASEPNAGFVQAVRTPGESEDRCLVEFANPGREPVRTAFSLDTGGQGGTLKSDITLAAGERRRQVFDVPAGLRAVRASLGDDALAVDNSVTLIAARRKKVRVSVRLYDAAVKAAVERACGSAGTALFGNDAPDLVFSDNPAYGSVGRVWVIRLITGKEGATYVGPFLVDRAHPVTQGISLDGVAWGAVTNQCPGLPVVMAGNIPLVTCEERVTGANNLWIQFCPASSTVQDTPAWPVLFWNILHWRAGSLPGAVEANCRVGSDLVFNVPPDERQVEAACPDGTRKRFDNAYRQVRVPCEQAGIYRLAAGDTADEVCANFLGEGESNLGACASGEWGSWHTAKSVEREYRGVAWAFLLPALAILCGHMVVVAKGAKAMAG